jgi:hypothetical protein
MIVSVLDAKMNWCPFAKTSGNSRIIGETFDAQGNLPSYPATGCRCIASDCMMWRKVGQIGITPEGKKTDRDMDGRTRWIDTGYCGLAGKPDQTS